jgi:hypothetical protein
MARFVAMLAWVALLEGGYLAYRSIAPHIGDEWARWFVSIGTLVACIWVGNWVQRRVLGWLDPDGELRRRVATAARLRS